MLESFIPRLENESFGEIVSDGDGFPCARYSDTVIELMAAISGLAEDNPDLFKYEEILAANGISWNLPGMKNADISSLDDLAIQALLIAAVRAERFSDGTILALLESGVIQRWIKGLEGSL